MTRTITTQNDQTDTTPKPVACAAGHYHELKEQP